MKSSASNALLMGQLYVTYDITLYDPQPSAAINQWLEEMTQYSNTSLYSSSATRIPEQSIKAPGIQYEINAITAN